MTTKKYTWIRVAEESKKELDARLKNINEKDLPKIGVRNKQVKQIDLTNFLFKNRIFISDSELMKMAKKKFGGKKC